MENLALVVNTINKNEDVWNMFFTQLKKHVDPNLFNKKYLFVDEPNDKVPEDFIVRRYDRNQVYRDQFVSCMEGVEEQYCVYVSEDYVLYEDARDDLIGQYVKALDKNPELSFIRFMKGGVIDQDFPKFKNYDNLHVMHHSLPYFYTNQVAVWRTKDLHEIHRKGPQLHIANEDWQNSFEWQATKTCQELDIQGVYCYHGEEKRGLYHYDTIVFPHVSTALVKGKWNVTGYPVEMGALLEEYEIDTNIRGTV
jgi:hypothetical protein